MPSHRGRYLIPSFGFRGLPNVRILVDAHEADGRLASSAGLDLSEGYGYPLVEVARAGVVRLHADPTRLPLPLAMGMAEDEPARRLCVAAKTLEVVFDVEELLWGKVFTLPRLAGVKELEQPLSDPFGKLRKLIAPPVRAHQIVH